MTTEIAGLAVTREPPGLMTPLSAVAVIKGLNDDGEITWWRVQTHDVTVIEAIGMHEAAAHMHKETLPR